jgi:hypothetical protein
VSTALGATYGVGRATAKLVVEEWLGQKIIGNWECERCGQQVTMQAKPNYPCPSPYGVHRWEYREPGFVSQEYGVSGSIDAFVDLGQKLITTEIKILNVDDWETLIAPLAEHRIRTSMYLKIIADSGSPFTERINLHEARTLYVSRGYGKKHLGYNEILPFKEFVVQRDDALLSRPLAMAKQVKVFREQQLVPSGICSTALDKHARACTTCHACFGGKYPAAQPAIKPW